jgi:hypothetical protein
MPIKKKWSVYNKENASNETDNYSVYELGNVNTSEILYIGEGHLRTRLLSHLTNGSEPVVGANGYRFELTGSKLKCTQRQNTELTNFLEVNY